MRLFLLAPVLGMFVSSALFADVSTATRSEQTFKMDEVTRHNTHESCYMIYKGGVYDFTRKLAPHKEKFLDIQSWCGKDMTPAFETKNNTNVPHKAESIKKLEDFYIGKLVQ